LIYPTTPEVHVIVYVVFIYWTVLQRKR